MKRSKKVPKKVSHVARQNMADETDAHQPKKMAMVYRNFLDTCKTFSEVLVNDGLEKAADEKRFVTSPVRIYIWLTKLILASRKKWRWCYRDRR